MQVRGTRRAALHALRLYDDVCGMHFVCQYIESEEIAVCTLRYEKEIAVCTLFVSSLSPRKYIESE